VSRILGLFVVSGAMLGGCGADAVGACEKAGDAYTVCADAYCEGVLAGECGEPVPVDETLTCEAVYGETKGDAAKTVIEGFECQEAAASGADCSTQEGYDAFIVAFGECSVPAA
jgi:hypothetical protein